MEATGVHVPNEVIRLCETLYERHTQPTAQLIKSYYEDRLHLMMPKNAFHFLNRLYLIQGDEQIKQRMETYRDWYIGRTVEEHKACLKKTSMGVPDVQFSQERQEYLEQYADILVYDRLLFKTLLSRTIFDVDVWPIVKELVPLAKFSDMYEALQKDISAVAFLSTFAVNFLWLFSMLEGKDTHHELATLVLGMTQGVYDFRNPAHVHLAIYLLTHAIIGESQFYSRPIEHDSNIYGQMLIKVEDLIQEHYHSLSLDIKCEFLVCAHLLQYKSPLAPIITSEATVSLAEQGNFLVDKWNMVSRRSILNLDQREHTNVLFLMTQLVSQG
jgi:hypothetical protein